MRKQIPNLITLLNLTAGFIAITFLIAGNLKVAVFLVFAAAVFDFLDGTAARILHAYSPVGKSLDSLSDMVSFGVLPGIMVFLAASDSLPANMIWPAYMALLIPVFSAIRLAVFDNDPGQKENFRGIPVPANAVFQAALTWIFLLKPGSFISELPLVYLSMSLSFSLLQVVFVPVLSMKFKTAGLKENLSRYILIIVSLLLTVMFRWEGILLAMVFYLVLSLLTLGKRQ